MIKEKLKFLKERLKWWSKEVFGWLDLNIENIVEDLNALESGLSQGSGIEDVVKRKEVYVLF